MASFRWPVAWPVRGPFGGPFGAHPGRRAGGTAHGQFRVPEFVHRGLAGIADQVDQDLGAARAGGTDRGARGGEGGALGVVAEIAQHVVVADQRDVPAKAQAAFPAGPSHADGGDHRGDDERGRRVRRVEHGGGCGISIGLGHHVGGHERGVDGNAACDQRLFVAGAAAGGEIEVFLPVDERDPPMTEIEKKVGGLAEGGRVRDVEPAVIGGRPCPPVDKEGQAKFLQKRHARVVDLRALHHHPVDRAVGGHLAIGILGAVGADDRQEHVVPFAGIDLPGAGEEIGENGVHHLGLARKRDDMADGHGTTGGETARPAVGGVVGGAGGGENAGAGLLAHLGIAVQGAAYGGLR
jgi:hypothetical protein